MGVQSRYTDDQKRKAVEQYSKGTPVRALASQYKVSVAGLYQWIAKAKGQVAEEAKQATKRPETIQMEHRIDLELHIKNLEQENALLRKRLFDLFMKTGAV